MKKKLSVFLSLGMVVFSLLGIFDATYLTYQKFTGQTVLCGRGWDCGKVLNSPWANVGPVPLSLLGVIFYATVFVLSICAFLEIELPPTSLPKNLPAKSLWRVLLLGVTSIGFACSLLFIGLMAFSIQAWCKFCVISALTSTFLFLMSYGLSLEKKK